MTGKRSSRSGGVADQAMLAWYVEGVTSVDMFAEAAAPAKYPQGEEASEPSGAAPHPSAEVFETAAGAPKEAELRLIDDTVHAGNDGTKLGGEATSHADVRPSAASPALESVRGPRQATAGEMGVEVLLISKRTHECSVRIKGELIRARGVRELGLARLRAIATGVRDMCCSISRVADPVVGMENFLDLYQGTATPGTCLSFPPEMRQLVESVEMQHAIADLVQRLEKTGNQNASQEQLHEHQEEVACAAQAIKAACGGADLHEGMSLQCEAWVSEIKLPTKIAKPDEAKPSEKTDYPVGAFRGFNVDMRLAFFSENAGRNANLDIEFDEKTHFDVVKLLSTSERTKCEIEVKQHWIGERIDRHELVRVIRVQADLYEDGENLNREIERLQKNINRS